MEFIELKTLILAQIGIDIAIIIVFVFLIKRFNFFKKYSSLNNGLNKYEKMLIDADRISGQFQNQLEEKKHTIKALNKQIDKRITSLNLMLNRADTLLFDKRQYGSTVQSSLDIQKREILKLAKQGHNVEYIADTLSVSREEVMLVLDLKKNISQAENKKGEF